MISAADKKTLRSLAIAASDEWNGRLSKAWPDADDIYDDVLDEKASEYAAAVSPNVLLELLDELDQQQPSPS